MRSLLDFLPSLFDIREFTHLVVLITAPKQPSVPVTHLLIYCFPQDVDLVLSKVWPQPLEFRFRALSFLPMEDSWLRNLFLGFWCLELSDLGILLSWLISLILDSSICWSYTMILKISMSLRIFVVDTLFPLW